MATGQHDPLYYRRQNLNKERGLALGWVLADIHMSPEHGEFCNLSAAEQQARVEASQAPRVSPLSLLTQLFFWFLFHRAYLPLKGYF